MVAKRTATAGTVLSCPQQPRIGLLRRTTPQDRRNRLAGRRTPEDGAVRFVLSMYSLSLDDHQIYHSSGEDSPADEPQEIAGNVGRFHSLPSAGTSPPHSPSVTSKAGRNGAERADSQAAFHH